MYMEGAMLYLYLLISGFLIFSITGDDHSRLLVLERDFIFWRLNDRPEFASRSGDFRNSDRLERFTLEFMEKRMLKAKDYLDVLHAVNVDKVSKTDQINYKILQDMLESYIDGYRWREWSYLNPISWLEGNQQDPVLFVDATPFDTRGDFENYIARLNLMPRLFDEYVAFFQEAVRLGRTSNIQSMSRVEDQIADILKDDVNQSIYFSPFLDDLEFFNDTIPENVREDIRLRGTEAVTGVFQAYKNLQEYFVRDYFRKTRPGIGVGSLDGGRDYYKACLKWYLSLDMTPEEVHNLGLQEVERVVKEMRIIMERQGCSAYSMRDCFAEINHLKGGMLHTEEEIIQEYEHIISERIESTLTGMFRDLPGLPIKVEAMRSDGSRGQYISGSADGIRHAIFYANTYRPVPKYTMMSLAMHESNPGHHLQISYSVTADLPEFRKNKEYSEKFRVPFAFPSYAAYQEGWALYAEFLGIENNLYQNDYELIGYYESQLFRACRLVVDTGIHYFNWTKKQSIAYFTNHTSESVEGLDLEIDRYITWPGQAVAYKVGELKIRQLREFAEKELGEFFDIRDFHMVVLKNGAVPLKVLESMVTDWVQNHRNGHDSFLDPDDCECPSTPDVKVRCQRSSESRGAITDNKFSKKTKKFPGDSRSEASIQQMSMKHEICMIVIVLFAVIWLAV